MSSIFEFLFPIIVFGFIANLAALIILKDFIDDCIKIKIILFISFFIPFLPYVLVFFIFIIIMPVIMFFRKEK